MLNGMQLVPLATVALELGQTPEQLTQRLGDQVHVDGASGLRTVPAHVCKQLLAQHQQQLQAQAQAQAAKAEYQRAEQERLAAQFAAQERVRAARAERQRQILAHSPDLTPLEVMMATDANPDRRTPAGVAFDEIIASERRGHVGYGYRLTPTKE